MIIEIGPRPYIALAYPDETLFYSSRAAAEAPENGQVIASLGELWTALARTDVDLIVAHPSFSAPWTFRHLHRSILSRKMLEGHSPLLRAAAPELLRWRGAAPVVAIDHEDLPVINRSNLFLLDRCGVYFKRELPADHWRVFTKTAHANLPTPRFRTQKRALERLAKLRPISLGLPTRAAGLLPRSDRPKTADVFFAGRIDGSSTLRVRGHAELKALQAQGVIVDIPDAPLPLEAFYERCAAARIVWSPEGFGWDCFRHYEAAACGAAVLINAPTIDRHAPLVAGEHAIYYDPAPGGLTRAVTEALADTDALARIAAAGRAHVMAHHTVDALARHIVETGRGLNAGADPVGTPTPGSDPPGSAPS
ncbi:MAG TPA: glycosyltransferase [Caulobacteraceae bacterium]|nr:glycosyltransferase [Caulobacteraceae bacterium]HUO11310.1 glycosyltransferase [Caulobacteraceae bacterium]